MSRLSAALIAGAVAIALNTVALAAADRIPLTTAHGGLLRLLAMLSGGILPPFGAAFRNGFHLVVGIAMAVLYAFVLEPRLRGPAWWRGLRVAAAAWLVNAAIVLPATGEGFAGCRTLSAAGMSWFAAAHTLFFVLLAILYAHLRPKAKVTIMPL